MNGGESYGYVSSPIKGPAECVDKRVYGKKIALIMCPLTFVRGSGSRRATPLADRIVIIQYSRLFYGLQENWDKIRVAYWTEHRRFTIFSPGGTTILGKLPT